MTKVMKEEEVSEDLNSSTGNTHTPHRTWTAPKPHEEHDEVHTQQQAPHGTYPDHVHKMLNHLADKNNYHSAMKKAKPVTVNKINVKKMSNTDAYSPKPPKLDKVKDTRVKKQFASGKPMQKPIVLHDTHTGHMHLLAGNTRLTHNTHGNHPGAGKTPVHAIQYSSKKLGETYSKNIDEGKFKDMVTKDQENKRLGKTSMIANPRTQKVRKVTPSRAKMAVKKGFVYAEHIEGLEEADAFKGQPVGVTVTMKHKQTGQKQKTSFPGTHSAVAGAKSHIAQMQKKGYAVHSKNLMYGKSEEQVDEVSTKTLSNYMQKSAASVSGKDAKTQDKRIAGQSMADKKIRKADGYSSTAKVAATNEGKEYLEPDMKQRQKNNEKARQDMKKMGTPMKNPALGEARRGRPPKASAAGAQDTETRHNIIHQLRKSVSLRGQHKVEFKDGKQHKVSAQHAAQALNKYNNLRTTGEKATYQKQLHKSHDSFHDARQSKTPGAAEPKRGVSLGGSDRLKKLMSKYK
jgi:hypothetical protein